MSNNNSHLSESYNKHDIINTVTGEHLKENPFIELHDQTVGFLKYE